MRYSASRQLVAPACLVLSVLFTGVATAQDEPPENQDRNERRAEMRQRILDEFDADGDGEMNEEERAAAREQMRRRRGNRPNAGDARPPREGRPPRDGQSPRDGNARRRGGQGPMADPGALFDRFDADEDGQLSRDEFMKLTEQVRANRPQGPGAARGNRDGARPRRPGRPDGPPEEGRGRMNRERPRDNPGDRPGPPPRPEGRRRLNDEDPPQGRLREGRGRRGPAGEGFGPPPPETVFQWFDENDDNQLSQDEFRRLADRMRQMQERMGRAGERGGPRGEMQRGRDSRRGAQGEEGQRRRPRRPRPDSESEADAPASDDNSV